MFISSWFFSTMCIFLQLQQAENDRMRQKEANLTALAAIGPRKKRKTDAMDHLQVWIDSLKRKKIVNTKMINKTKKTLFGFSI